MKEVCESNLFISYEELKCAINNASFIAIDAEFTGINSEESLNHSLFDTLTDRYRTLRRNIQRFIILQFGIVVFHHDLPNNTYKAECYNFYLLPRSLPFKNRQFSWQVTALEFLCKNNFQFNKCLHHGISYIDEIDEKILRQHFEQDNFEQNLEQLTYDEQDDLMDCNGKVFEWLNKKPTSILKLNVPSPILQYMIHKNLRNKFKNIWTVSKYKSINIMQVTDDIRKLLEKQEKNDLKEALIDSCLGFSKIFKLLTSSKIPIIGHNILLDLMFMHQQFYKPLPNSYKEFKNNIHTLFPQIYDTKFLSFELRRLFDKDEVSWKINSLNILYEYFTAKGAQLAFNSPMVKLNEECSDRKMYHTAGWDAYFSGYIFVKMGYLFCVKKFGEGLEEREVTHSELMSGVKNFVNSVNITRGNELYMKLDGADPALSRPEWLHVKLISPHITSKKLIDTFSSYGQVDIMPFSRKRVLVAVANHKSALYILQQFKSSKEFQVTRYSRIRHAAPSTVCLWGGMIISGSMFAWMINKMLLKPM